jgi:tRNA wybutosine-synthesizing protein 3
MDSFQQRKKEILSKDDKSSIGGWDEHIKELCEKINSFEEYYTTSSCSGRIIVMVDQEKKGPGLFEFVSHEFVDFEIGEKGLRFRSLSKAQPNHEPYLFAKSSGKKVNLKFKSEPPILHVACKNLDSAEKLLNKVRDCGWKRSGIISLGKNIIVEIISTEKIEFPLVKEGEMLVSEDFLKIVLEKANENLKKGWDKIEKLKNSLD